MHHPKLSPRYELDVDDQVALDAVEWDESPLLRREHRRKVEIEQILQSSFKSIPFTFERVGTGGAFVQFTNVRMMKLYELMNMKPNIHKFIHK